MAGDADVVRPGRTIGCGAAAVPPEKYLCSVQALCACAAWVRMLRACVVCTAMCVRGCVGA